MDEKVNEIKQLFKKYINHIEFIEGVNYLSNSYINESNVNFTEKEIKILKELQKNDVLVILGKGREEYQDVNGEKIFYSDIKIIEEFTQ